jgi:hypothetical protein
LQGEPASALGISGNALSFDGIYDYIYINHSNSLVVGKYFSISLWVKPKTDNIEFVTKAINSEPWTGFCLRYLTGNTIDLMPMSKQQKILSITIGII